MKFILILYAIIGIIVQVLAGHYTGYGQGSIGLILFLFLVEIDPRLKFSYIVPNIKMKYDTMKNGENNE